ncbi:hypothetical protein SNEBB_001708 [Seison nebaliae]|nr:hypothetical protein SNEBB_001708 [Seison nebaliae]
MSQNSHSSYHYSTKSSKTSSGGGVNPSSMQRSIPLANSLQRRSPVQFLDSPFDDFWITPPSRLSQQFNDQDLFSPFRRRHEFPRLQFAGAPHNFTSIPEPQFPSGPGTTMSENSSERKNPDGSRTKTYHKEYHSSTKNGAPIEPHLPFKPIAPLQPMAQLPALQPLQPLQPMITPMNFPVMPDFKSPDFRQTIIPALSSDRTQATDVTNEHVKGTLTEGKEIAYRVVIDVFGFHPKDLDVRIQGRTLLVRGSHIEGSEESYSKKELSKSFDLPSSADPNKMHWRITDEGALVIEVEKHENSIEYSSPPAIAPSQSSVHSQPTAIHHMDSPQSSKSVTFADEDRFKQQQQQHHNNQYRSTYDTNNKYQSSYEHHQAEQQQQQRHHQDHFSQPKSINFPKQESSFILSTPISSSASSNYHQQHQQQQQQQQNQKYISGMTVETPTRPSDVQISSNEQQQQQQQSSSSHKSPTSPVPPMPKFEDDLVKKKSVMTIEISRFDPNTISVNLEGNDVVIVRAASNKSQTGVASESRMEHRSKLPTYANSDELGARLSSDGLNLYVEAPFKSDHRT